PRTRLAAMFLSIAMLPAMARLVACAGSLLLLLGAHRSQSRPSASLAPSLFIGVGALRESGLIQALATERSEEVSFLNETSLKPLSAVQHLRWRERWREWRGVARLAWAQLGGADPSAGLPPANRRVEFLTQAHRYAYLRAWFRKLRAQSQVREPVVFSAAST